MNLKKMDADWGKENMDQAVEERNFKCQLKLPDTL